MVAPELNSNEAVLVTGQARKVKEIGPSSVGATLTLVMGARKPRASRLALHPGEAVAHASGNADCGLARRDREQRYKQKPRIIDVEA